MALNLLAGVLSEMGDPQSANYVVQDALVICRKLQDEELEVRRARRERREGDLILGMDGTARKTIDVGLEDCIKLIKTTKFYISR